MLILSRRIGEAFMIGDNVKVVILQTRRGQIKIGIEAPADHTVLREELYLSIRQEKLNNAKETEDLLQKPSK